jgi:1,4-dihydroxy-2-naphthoate octaprenyltransferase
MMILFRLVSYRKDLWLKRNTIIVRIGWKQGIFFHNLLILSSFILFGIALSFGFSIRLAGLVFLTLPFALYLIWYLSQLETGAPARWLWLTTLSMVVFFLPIYMLTFSAWIG